MQDTKTSELRAELKILDDKVSYAEDELNALRVQQRTACVALLQHLGWKRGAIIQNKKGKHGVYLSVRGTPMVENDSPWQFYFAPFRLDGKPANSRMVAFASDEWVLTGEQYGEPIYD